MKSDEKTETYVGLTDTPFKARYNNHKQSLNKPAYKNQTELSKYSWELKEKLKNFQLPWKILGRARAYSNLTKKYGLCTLEEYFILCHREMASLNKRSGTGRELQTRHQIFTKKTIVKYFTKYFHYAAILMQRHYGYLHKCVSI